MKLFLTILMLLLLIGKESICNNQNQESALPCKADSCDFKYLENIFLNIEGATEKQIFDFLCNFCGVCDKSVEYEEVSNETLYLLLTSPKKVDIVVGLLEKNQTLPFMNILIQLENPIHGDLDFQKAYDNVKNIVKYKKTRNRIMRSIILGVESNGGKISK